MPPRPTVTLGPAYFERIYADRDDPWDFETSAYERDKYLDTLAALPPGRRYAQTLELGCSVGVLTAQLATRSEALLATEINPRARRRAQERCSDLAHVEVIDLHFPQQSLPGKDFDLVVLSEVAYYWAPADFERAIQELYDLMLPGAHLLAVHYTPTETDYPLTGDEVHEGILARSAGRAPKWLHVHGHRRSQYRLDLLAKR